MKDIRQQWTALAAAKQITRQDIASLCIYRSLVKEQGKDGALSRLQKSFTPVTNKVKLENGAHPQHALRNALWLIKQSSLWSWLETDEQRSLEILSKELSKEIK